MGIATRLRPWVGVALLVFSAATLAQNAMTTEPADLYAGPDDSYPVVAQLDPNSPIQVMGCLDDWSWCDVAAEDTRGWMYAPDITYAYQGGYVPLYSYAPGLGIAIVPFSLDVYWGRYYHGRPFYAQRQDWAHRTIHHRRPEGPPPHAGPPPRPEHREPVHRLGPDRHADDERHAEAQRHDNPQDNHNMSKRPESPRPGEASPRPETHAAPGAPAHEPPHEAPHPAPHEAPREAPHQPAHEEHAPGRGPAAPHEEHPHDDHPH